MHVTSVWLCVYVHGCECVWVPTDMLEPDKGDIYIQLSITGCDRSTILPFLNHHIIAVLLINSNNSKSTLTIKLPISLEVIRSSPCLWINLWVDICENIAQNERMQNKTVCIFYGTIVWWLLQCNLTISALPAYMNCVFEQNTYKCTTSGKEAYLFALYVPGHMFI